MNIKFYPHLEPGNKFLELRTGTRFLLKLTSWDR